ncbi:MAG: 50S ribosomal protein L35 [Candidatus Schekmanbacteria bacterium]|nr:50S ribosomal protein L35 [Candidatus Schekmanbacteria bacterium]
MPKMKSNRGAAKRFRVTGSGKLKFHHAFTSHILTKKSTKRKRNLRKGTYASAMDLANVRRLVPYI